MTFFSLYNKVKIENQAQTFFSNQEEEKKSLHFLVRVTQQVFQGWNILFYPVSRIFGLRTEQRTTEPFWKMLSRQKRENKQT